ncbi:MAG: hypothetical protein KDD35_05480 [Bdellovibrionales bacterium]|nr:hypothetical protein [Bdellovibrionales bacterium]
MNLIYQPNPVACVALFFAAWTLILNPPARARVSQQDIYDHRCHQQRQRGFLPIACHLLAPSSDHFDPKAQNSGLHPLECEVDHFKKLSSKELKEYLKSPLIETKCLDLIRQELFRRAYIRKGLTPGQWDIEPPGALSIPDYWQEN